MGEETEEDVEGWAGVGGGDDWFGVDGRRGLARAAETGRRRGEGREAYVPLTNRMKSTN